MYFILASSLIMFQAHFSELIEKHLSLKNLLESLVCNFVLCCNKITFSQISNYLNQMYIPKAKSIVLCNLLYSFTYTLRSALYSILHLALPKLDCEMQGEGVLSVKLIFMLDGHMNTIANLAMPCTS